MAAKIFRVNYKSDFILTLNSDAGWMTPFCIKFWTGAPSQAYFVGYDGTTYTHCAPVAGEPTKLLVQFDDHHLPIGNLQFQIAYHFTVADFPNDTEDEVINPASIIIEINGEQYQVMLDFTGETAPEIEFSLPAYANEAQRIANEEQRIENEQQRIANEQTRIANEQTRQQNEERRIAQETARVNEFATLKRESQQATTDANDAATLAIQKAQLAQDKADLAQAAANLANEKAALANAKAELAASAATLANEKAALAQQKAEYAQQQGGYAKDQGDYAKDQGDYAKAQGETAQADHERAEADHGIAVDDHTQAGNDHTRAESDHGIAVDDHTQAGNDHTRAESDHGIAVDDHTQAGNDHTRAESDHGIAADDHTQAGNDHTRAESDHTRAESDHAAVEVYVDSLGAFDISAYHATGGVLAKYADLTAALGIDGANIPSDLRKGGMSVKFVQSSDNKYVQYRLMATSFSTTESDWQGVDTEPTAGSHNFVESGGVAKENINLVPLNRGKNLFDKNSNYIVSGKYIDTYNTIQSSTNYNISGLIPIKVNTDYYISQGNDGAVGSSSGNFRFYDENCQDLGRSFLIDATNKQITTPANAHYIQISYYHVFADSLMINEGNERGDYMPYNPVGSYPFSEVVNNITTDFTLFQKNPTNGASLFLKSFEALYRNGFFRTNLFDSSDINYITGYYLSSIGNLLENSSYATSGYVPFFQWMQYLKLSINGQAGGGSGYICLYDKYGTLINSYTSSSVSGKATWEAGVAYVRFSINSYQNGNIMIEIGDSIGSYIPYGTFVIKNAIGTSDIADNSITEGKLKDNSVGEIKLKDGCVSPTKTSFFKFSTNLFDVGKATDNKYVLSTTGNLSDNTAYMASDYIKVITGSDYYSNVLGDYAWYNANKVYISGGTRTSTGSTIFTAPEGAVYLRASVRKNYNANKWMIAKSSVAVDYEPYYQYINDENINPQTKNFVSSIQGENALSVEKETMTDVSTFTIGETTYNGETLTISDFPYYMKKGNCISLYADITSFGSLFIGDGLNGYIGSWLKIDATNVVHQQMGEAGTNPTDESTSEHGLTIGTFIKVSMYISMDGKLHLNLQTLDGTFSTTIETWNTNNGGAIFLATSGCSLANIKMNLSNSDFRRPVWAFGDSYFGFNYNRVMGCLKDLGFMNFLINGFPGNNSQLEYQDLERCMSFGTPKYILWCLGMNDTNNGFQTYFDKLTKLCQDNGIILIGYTVPTVPTRNKETINQYVKENISRYIDAYKAVGTNSSGEWYSNYLSSDGIHPTELGAKAIAMQILTDFPEIMQYGIEAT